MFSISIIELKKLIGYSQFLIDTTCDSVSIYESKKKFLSQVVLI